MKIFANKNIWKKIIIIFLLISSFSFIGPKPVSAGIGGELMSPICDLLTGLCDGIIGVMHNLIIKQDVTLIRVDLNTTVTDVLRVVVTVLAFVAAVAVIGAVTGGVGIGLSAAISAIAGTTATATTSAIAVSAIIAHIVPILVTGGYLATKAYNADGFNNEVDLPLYSLSPEAIFTNNIPLFNVNFFEKDPANKIDYAWALPLQVTEEMKKDELYNKIGVDNMDKATANTKLQNYNTNVSEIESLGTKSFSYYYYIKDNYIIRMQKLEADVDQYTLAIYDDTKGKVIENAKTEGDDGGSIYAFSNQLSDLIFDWYYALRLLAIVGMMSVLVYIGIRILLSSTSPQKAKYKQLLGDWLVGMVLLFTMQYIMIVANIFTDNISDLLSKVNPNKHAAIIEDKDEKITKALTEAGIEVVDYQVDQGEGGNVNKQVYRYKDKDGKYYIEWHTTLMGHMRLELMYNKKNDDKYIGYTIMFMVMVLYLIIFSWTYIKRVIYMAFLTLISPLVALTYPIDKANDGQAQGFNYWFKEYIFNLLLQPLHLLIYTVLVSSAIELASTNWVYALVALGFMTTAEKIVRQMFNFSKASTPGVFGGAAGAALAFGGMKWLLGRGGDKGGKGGSGAGGQNSSGKDADGNTITSGFDTKDMVDVNETFGNTGAGETSGGTTQNRNVITDGDNSDDWGNVPRFSESAYDTTNTLPPVDEFANIPGFSESAYDVTSHSVEPDIVADNMPELAEGVSATQDLPTSTGGYQASRDEGSSNAALDNVRNNIGGYTDEQIDDIIRNGATAGNRRFRRLNNKLGRGELTSADRDAVRRRESFKRGMGNAMSLAKDEMATKLTRSLKNADPINSLGRLAAGAGLGAAAGMVGIAAATTSGQPDNILKMGGAGAVLGAKAGAGIYDRVSDSTKIDGLEDELERGFLGEEEYKRKMAEKAQKEKARQEETIRKIQEKMKITREEAKQRANEWAPKYMNQKINDVNDWILLEKMQKQHREDDPSRTYSFEEAVSAYKVHKRSGFEGKDKEKALKKIKSDWNITNEEIANRIYTATKAFDNLKNS